VIAILDVISNSGSAQPAAASPGQRGACQSAPGGFASTLAAAQGLGSTPPSVTTEVKAASGLVAVSAGASNLNVRLPASENSQLKKLAGGSPAASSVAGAVNLAVPETVPAIVSPLPGPPLQASMMQLSLAPANLTQPSLTRPILPALTVVAQIQVPELSSAMVQTKLQTSYNVSALSAAVGYSELAQTLGSAGSLASADGMTSTLTNPSTSAGATSNTGAPTTSQETATANSAPSPLPTAKTTASSPYVTGTEPGPQNGLWPAGPVLAESPPPVLSTATGQPPPTAFSPEVVKITQGSASPASGEGLWSAVAMHGTDQVSDSAALAPALLANGETGFGSGAGVLPASLDVQSGQVSAANVTAGDIATATSSATATAVPTDVGAQTGTENAPVPVMSGQPAGTAIPSMLAPLAPVRTALRSAVASVAEVVTTPSIRGAGPGAGAPSQIVTSDVPAAPASAKALPVANQTPFSVFFSGAGPGTESAASVLPRMILPATSSAVRDSHTSLTQAPGTLPPTNGFESGGTHNAAAQNSVAQNVVATNTKDTSAGTGSGALPVGQALRADGNLSAAAQSAVSQTAAAPVLPPPAPAGVILPVAAPVALVGDSLPKTDTVAGSAPGGAANIVALPAETSAVAPPGPVQMAQMVSRVEQSEMRIGMTTSAFGSVEVRTMVHANDVGLVIGSEKGDLRALLSNDLPAIANTLLEQNLRLHSVNFMQGFAFSNHASGGGDSQQRSFVPMRAVSSDPLSEAAVNDSTEVLPAGEFAGGGSSLSILA
jgi:hypothetical protein